MRAWMRRGLLACALLPLSCLFRLLIALRRGLYTLGLLRVTRLPVPVIVVGNIFVGGTGKTPLVIWLVHALQSAGYTPGVISRGYGASAENASEVAPDADPLEVGDEPVLIAQHTGCPVVVGRDRVKAGKALLQFHSKVNVIVCDDGLQHYALQRDIETVLFDERGIGNGWLLPAGPLREPANRRRDFTVVNGAANVPSLPAEAISFQLRGTQAISLVDVKQTVNLSDMAGRPARIVAAAGIGNPARFFTMLRGAGLTFTEMPLTDHYAYSENPFAKLEADIILITEKDAVKCRLHDALKNDARLWVVPVDAQPESVLLEKILEKLRGLTTA